MRTPVRALAVLLAVALARTPIAAGQDVAAQDVAAQDGAAGAVSVPAPTEKAMRYYRSGCVLWLVNSAWGLVLPALFLFTGLSARVRNWARAIGRWWLPALGAYVVMFLAINFLFDLPLDYYQGFLRQHDYGLSNQSFGTWFGDSVKRLLVGVIVGVVVVPVLDLLVTRSPKRWWLYTSFAAVPFILFMAMVTPLWIDPLFNEFGPMKDPALETKILSLAQRAGIDAGRVYEVNKSVDTETVNAYVTGFLGTKRIVLWDTTIAKLGEDELLFVMAHEMGHYALRHVVKGIGFSFVMILAALYVIHRTAGICIRRFKGRWRFDRLSDVASVPLLIGLANVLSLIGAPVVMGFTRHIEHEADRFALELTRDNRGGARAFVALQVENLGNPRPGPLYKLWRASHPTLGDRIDFCNEYRPWETGEPLIYGDLFVDPR